jgi:hypothetical protein
MPNVKHGLQHVVQRWLKIELPKELQKSDWGGELTPEQIEYAVNDVAVLIQLDGVINQHMAKAALHFEFGVFKSNATGLEIGYQLEGFQKKIPLITTAKNKQFFQSAYFTLFFGFRK